LRSNKRKVRPVRGPSGSTCQNAASFLPSQIGNQKSKIKNPPDSPKNKKKLIMKNSYKQLELGTCLRSSKSNISRSAGRKSKTACLWFARMRQIVDSAPDWPALPRRSQTQAARPLQPPLIPARTITLSPPVTDQHHFTE